LQGIAAAYSFSSTPTEKIPEKQRFALLDEVSSVAKGEAVK